MTFWHLMTNTPVHPKEPDVLKLMGATAPEEMLPSLLGKQLGAVPRHDPGAADHARRGVAERRAELRRAGAADHPAAGAQGDARPIRRAPLSESPEAARSDADAAQRCLPDGATPAQKAYIDSLITSQTQVRNIRQDLLDALASIKDNSVASQITAAIALIQMNVTPVIAIHIPFGGDNHHDTGSPARRRRP